MNPWETYGQDCKNRPYIRFNASMTTLSVVTNSCCRLFSLEVPDKIEEIYKYNVSDVFIFERILDSNLVAISTKSERRALIIRDFKTQKLVKTMNHSNKIISIKFNRIRFVSCSEEFFYIRDMSPAMCDLHKLKSCALNPTGLFALSSTDESLIAYPSSRLIGELTIFDAIKMNPKINIRAHKSILAALQFSQSGSKLATASEIGTVIRVFDVSEGVTLFEFRRGITRYINISSLAFSYDDKQLALSSNTATIHLFSLEEPSEEDRPGTSEQAEGWIDSISKIITETATAYLPTEVTDVFTQERSFAAVYLPTSGVFTVCSLATIQQITWLFVAASNGFLYVYNFGVKEGFYVPAYQYNIYDEQLHSSEIGSESKSGVDDCRHSSNESSEKPKLTSKSEEVNKSRPESTKKTSIPIKQLNKDKNIEIADEAIADHLEDYFKLNKSERERDTQTLDFEEGKGNLDSNNKTCKPINKDEDTEISDEAIVERLEKYFVLHDSERECDTKTLDFKDDIGSNKDTCKSIEPAVDKKI